MMTYTFRRGETFLLALQIVAGDPATVATLTAALRPALVSDPSQVDPAQAKVADFTVALQSAASDGSYPAFWLLTLSASSSAALQIGSYLVDGRLTLSDGTIDITEPLRLVVTEPATVA